MVLRKEFRVAAHTVPFAFLISFFLARPMDWFFLLVPVLILGWIAWSDHYKWGKFTGNPAPEQEKSLSEDPYFRYLNFIQIPFLALFIVWCAYEVSRPSATWGEFVALAVNLGFVAGVVGINTGHELIHKNTRLERFLGGLILSFSSYATFKIEHIYGHHVHVSTPEDASSAKYGQTLYAFLPQAIVRNVINAWKIQNRRLKKRGQRSLSIHNELIGWTLLSLTWATLLGLAFGWKGFLFFFAQSLMAIIMLETINYVEHYGLARRKLSNGRYEKVTPKHSWNSSHALSNVILINLQRHSDHHANPARRYQVLRHFDESPQLPTGYAGMFLLAWFPPLWFKVMNPRVEAYYQDNEGRPNHPDAAMA